MHENTVELKKVDLREGIEAVNARIRCMRLAYLEYLSAGTNDALSFKQCAYCFLRERVSSIATDEWMDRMRLTRRR